MTRNWCGAGTNGGACWCSARSRIRRTGRLPSWRVVCRSSRLSRKTWTTCMSALAAQACCICMAACRRRAVSPVVRRTSLRWASPTNPKAGAGGLIRPGVVWFGESLPEDVLAGAFAAARACDLLLAIGTSGLVQPAARIPALARQAGARVVQVNPAPTALDDDCTWSLRGAAGVILPQLLASASMLPNAPVRGGQCAADQGRAGP